MDRIERRYGHDYAINTAATEEECRIAEAEHRRLLSRNILQARHLLDKEKCALTRQRFGALTGKYVLYLGEKTDIGGISYRNVEKFLKRLPAFTMREADEAEQPDLGPAL